VVQGKHVVEVVAPTVVEYFPAAQDKHVFIFEYVPVGQELMHELDPGIEYVPVGQELTHEVHPESAYVPAAQGVHAD
jgi:hypothetical protein